MEQERFALKLSAAGALVSAALGIGFAWSTGSEAIKLDGFFSLIGFVISLVTLRVAELVRRPGDQRFQFGYAAFEPTLNTVKGLLILLVCVFSFVTSLGDLFGEGRDLAAGGAVIYAALAATLCFALAINQRRLSRKVASPLVEVDAKNWMIDGVLSVMVGIVFLVAILLEGTRFDWLVPYIDPALVAGMSLLVVAVPLRIVGDGVWELLGGSPPAEIDADLRSRLSQELTTPEVSSHVVRATQVGRSLYVMVEIVGPADHAIDRLSDLDEVRTRVESALDGAHPRLVIDTVFTSRPIPALEPLGGRG